MKLKIKIYNTKIGCLRQRGFYLPMILMASVLFIALATAIISLSLSNVKIANLHNKKITSMAIAEAGIDYYMWHLSHDNTDYCDGMTCTESVPYGPYTHNYTDESGKSLGTYSIYITPPSVGSNITTVKSVGKVNGISPTRTIIATIGMPSFTKYTLMVNGNQLWVGPNEKISGTVHVNGSGLYNQGEITGDASSTELQYKGWFGTQPGVSGPGIFDGSKLFPVPSIDFNQVDVDVDKIRNEAKNLHEGDYYSSLNGAVGYHVVLAASTYELRKVTKYDNTGLGITKESLIGSYPYPSAGILFFEDNVWVEGTINNQKITILAENGQGQSKRVIVPNPIKYTNYNGSDKIGIISQSDILIAKNAPVDMEIDAAMIAKDGEIKINDYGIVKNGKMKVYGSIAHTAGLVWSYADESGHITSGYASTETVIDGNNVLNPPPKFPLTGTYSILSWREE